MDEFITTDPAICSGKPVIRGTRIMVKNILGMVAGGYAMKDILHAYPELTEPMVQAALKYAATVIEEHDRVVLTQDLPSENLVSGDIGTVVHIHKGGAGYEVEFMTLVGKTLAVATLLPSQVRPIGLKDMAHVRELATV